MFEQESYNHEVSQARPEKGDLFYNYEITNWNFSPRLYKILAISALVNILGIAIIAQTNLLTMRGCASPFVGRVCEVLDTVYVSSVLFGTERDVVDAQYDKIDLGNAEITYIDVSGAEPPFSYPEGYFQLANPEMAMMPEMDPFNAANGFAIPPLPPAGDMTSIPQVVPPSNPNAVTGNIPDSPFSIQEDSAAPSAGTRKNNRGGRPVPGNTKPEDAVANNETLSPDTNTNGSNPEIRTDRVTGDEINLRPLRDLLVFVSENNEKGVDLQSEFILSAQGRLNREGKFDPKTFKYLKAESPNKQLIEIVQESIEALNASGRLKVLQDLSGKDLNLLVQQDKDNITAVIQSEVESESRARSLQSGLNTLLSLAKSFKAGADASQNDKDELLLLESAQIETNGKMLVIKFAVPKQAAHTIIQRKLAEQKNEQAKPNGNASVKPADNTAKK